MRVRAFDRDANPDLMDEFLTDGKRKVPVFAVFDGPREVARWIERPAVAEPIVREMRAQYPPADSPDREAELRRVRAEMLSRLEAAGARAEVVREVRQALARGLGVAF
jgi:hypothetical protein